VFISKRRKFDGLALTRARLLVFIQHVASVTQAVDGAIGVVADVLAASFMIAAEFGLRAGCRRRRSIIDLDFRNCYGIAHA
jgi:hypothetical protein